MARPKLLHGAKILCYINGKLIGRVTALSLNPASPRKEARGIDIAYAQELMPTTVGVSGTIELLRVTGDGGAEGMGIVAQQPDIVREKYFTLLLIERQFGTTLFKADLCSAVSQNWRMASRQFIIGSVSFIGVTFSNEVSTG